MIGGSDRSQELCWDIDCKHWHGRVLSGILTHYCFDWDELPIDESCPEIGCCNCYKGWRGLVAKGSSIFWNYKLDWHHTQLRNREERTLQEQKELDEFAKEVPDTTPRNFVQRILDTL